MALFLALCRGPKSLCRGREESPDAGFDAPAKFQDDIRPITMDSRPAAEPDAELCPGQGDGGKQAGLSPTQLAVDMLIKGGHRYRRYSQPELAAMAYRSALSQQPGNQEALDGQRACASTTSSSSSRKAPTEDRAWPPPPRRSEASAAVDPSEVSVDVLLQGGHEYYELKRFQESLLAYNSVIARQTKCAEALCGRVHSLCALGRVEEATSSLSSALALVPDSTLLQSMVAASQDGAINATSKLGGLPADLPEKVNLSNQRHADENTACVSNGTSAGVVATAASDAKATMPDAPEKRTDKAKPKTKSKGKAKAKLRSASADNALAPKVSEAQMKKDLAKAGKSSEKTNQIEFEQPAQCPACRTEDDYKRELDLIKKKNNEILEASTKVKQSLNSKAKKNGQAVAMDPFATSQFNFSLSGSERRGKKEIFISFYQEQYARLKSSSVDLSKYNEDNMTSDGLTIKNGHQPMPKPPEGAVKLPPDYKQPVGVLTSEQLLRYDCFNQRMLICLHGDLFDVSDRPDKYSQDGPYWAMTGHDITWGLVCANDAEIEFDKYYDIFKIEPQDKMERQLQGLMSWWAFYWKEYGDPVGRLDVYDKEWQLPRPPELSDACCVM